MLDKKTCALLIGCLLVLGCADSLKKKLEGQPDAGDHERDDAAVSAEPGVVIETVIDASGQDKAIYFDLDQGKKVSAGEGWDLSFKRFRIQMNGGVSGAGGVQAVVLAADFDSVSEAPGHGFSSDRADGDDSDTDPDNIFNDGGQNDWYDYDVGDHTLSSKKLTYVISSSEQKLYKLVIDDYYDAAGSPAILSVRWARIGGNAPDPGTPPALDAGGAPDAVSGATSPDAGARHDAALPDAASEDAALSIDAGAGAGADAAGDAGSDAGAGAGLVRVEATSTTEWVYLDVSGQRVTPADPAQSSDWDLALKRSELRTNGGTSGKGQGGAKRAPSDVAYEALQGSDTYDFVQDELINTGAPGAMTSSQNRILAAWYDYNPSTHVVSPGDRNYIVRSALGAHAKLRIVSYQAGVFELRLEPIARQARQIDVDATTAGVWAYVSLRQGKSVVVSDPHADSSWDIALSRTRLQTNGGTSGAGAGAAAEAAQADPTAVGPTPATFSVDSELTSMGSTTSANAVLSAWYDYDVTTHVVSPRAAAFVVKTADGQLGALRILRYNSGVYRLGLSFAGASAP